MSICRSGLRIAQRVVTKVEAPIAELPVFLCPGLLPIRRARQPKYNNPSATLSHKRSYSAIPENVSTTPVGVSTSALQKLPRQCPGCGALTQFVDKEEAGFYTTSRKTIKDFLGISPTRDTSAEDDIVQAALQNAGAAADGLSFERQKRAKTIEPPFCDRCHDIIHHSNGVSIHHPSASAIQETILESPHKNNHIYHIIDAADFPMSLIPQLQKLLHATPQRSLNRRSKTDKYYRGKKIDMSFIITRADLLAAKKEQVDAMMPYLRTTLRDALGRSARDVRLGNVRCVSAKRQWWTGGLKEEIFKRGGGNWMVGKVNVGKSQLLHEIFPKGRREVGDTAQGYNRVILEAKADIHSAAEVQNNSGPESLSTQLEAATENIPLSSLGRDEVSQAELLNPSSLLPPLPPEVDYPTMPLVSSLPGTTTSPIRLPFGNSKGEMIDLPGLSRGDLELFVKPEHRASLVMRSRIKPSQQTLKPGQSLLLGGFIRITPTSQVDVLSYNFTPLDAHRTSTIKAVEIQAQSGEARNVPNIALPEAAKKMKLAGFFFLKWDVTKQRAGPLTNKNKVGMKPEKLPFRVLATDLLIEGVGWVELVAQIRRRPNDLRARESEPSYPSEESVPVGRSVKENVSKEADEKTWYSPMATTSNSESTLSTIDENSDFPVEWSATPKTPSHASDLNRKEDDWEEIDPNWPTFEVYTPEGRFVSTRRPMNAWLALMEKPKKEGARPRKSMKGKKKEEKRLRRGW